MVMWHYAPVVGLSTVYVCGVCVCGVFSASSYWQWSSAAGEGDSGDTCRTAV